MKEIVMLRKMRAGDPSGLEALMDRYIPYVSAIVWTLLRGSMSVEDGEEVVSDVFLAAWRQASAIGEESVRPWLASVARHKAMDRLRQRGLPLPLEDDALELPGGDDPADGLERAEERELVRRAVEELPDEDREIFLRYYYYAQRTREIAFTMGLNEATVKTRLRRGRLKLKEWLTREGLVYEA